MSRLKTGQVLNRPGVTQWLGGCKVEPDEPLPLAPGLYPYLVRVGPEFFKAEAPEILPPVNVTNALAQGAIRAVGWPATWRILGPLTSKVLLLGPPSWTEGADSVTVEGVKVGVFPFAAEGPHVDLGCLVGAEAEAPDAGPPPAALLP